jgi:hypothetical protein
LSGLKRCSLYVRPYVIQFPGSSSAWMILALSTSFDCFPTAGLVCDVLEGCCVPHPRHATMATNKYNGKYEGLLYSPLLRFNLAAVLRIGILPPELQNCPRTRAKGIHCFPIVFDHPCQALVENAYIYRQVLDDNRPRDTAWLRLTRLFSL